MLETLELCNVWYRAIRSILFIVIWFVRKGTLMLPNPVWFTKRLLRQTVSFTPLDSWRMRKVYRSCVAAFATRLWVRLDSAVVDTIRLLYRQPLCFLCVLVSMKEMTDIYETWHEGYAVEGHLNVILPTVSHDNKAETQTYVLWATLTVIIMGRDVILGGTRWFKYDRDDLYVNKSQFVPVIFEPPCISPESMQHPLR